MEQLPDAPWIRDAEMNGIGPADDTPRCPVCEQECDEIYTDLYGEAFGCNKCCLRWAAADWIAEQAEDPDDWDAYDDGR